MILISFVLCVIAIVLLGVRAVAGWLLGLLSSDAALLLTYAAIGITVVAAVLLAIGTFRARDEIFAGGSDVAPPKDGRSVPGAAAKAKAARVSGRASGKPGPARPTRTGAGARTAHEVGVRTGATVQRKKTTATSSSAAQELPGDVTVVVVPGRRRYHLANCRQLVGRTHEELTYSDAREEGFTPCTACMPDVALAARASAGEADDKEPSDEHPGSNDAAKGAVAADAPEASVEPDPPDSADVQDDGQTGTAMEEFAAVSDDNRRGG